MARSGSVPLLLLLLLPLLLTSVVANVYQQLTGVTNAVPWEMQPSAVATEADCANSCTTTRRCSGYVYDGGLCKLYVDDCRGPVTGDRPAPSNYVARNTCPGNATNPCACPEGFRRYGTRCLRLLDQPEESWFEAYPKCNSLSLDTPAHLAVPRSQAENDQLVLAATELQTEPLAQIWLDVYQSGTNEWYGDDGCEYMTLQFWASGQPDRTWGAVSYAPPGVDSSTGGWHMQDWENGSYKPLCQLDYCYRPDCPV